MEIPNQFIAKDVRTFQFQDMLPSLPVPDLDNTLNKYLESVRPIANDVEYLKTELIVNSFRTGLGKVLQDKFLKQTANQRNWLEKIWEDNAYLKGRYPTALLVNISGLGPYYFSVLPPKPGSQLERAGLILSSVLMFWDLIRKERLIPDPAGKGAVACMDQYKNMFSSCKRPGLKQDSLNFFFKSESEGQCPTHIVVACKGRFFKMEVLHPSGELLNPPEFEAQLRYIRESCERQGTVPGLGALTGDNRTRWAKNREYLLSMDPSHASHICDIETSIVVFALEDHEPQNQHEGARAGLAGDPTNRWFDKGVSQSVYTNGTSTSNCDHAGFDGMVYIYSASVAEICLSNIDGKWKGSMDIRPVAKPTELVFRYDDELISAINTARKTYDKLANDLEVRCPIYDTYGKILIRSFKQHPDAYVQMALQLAYYRMHKKPAPTYETAGLRRYFHGRTETLRSCTSEAMQWAKSMVDPNENSTMQLELFHKAMQKHITNMIEATDLKGGDRHLLALSVIAAEEGIPTPDIFTDPSFSNSGGGGNFILSTSLVGYLTAWGGCAPMCDHGYGVFYSIQPERVCFYVTSWIHNTETDAHQLFLNIKQSFEEIRTLLESATAKATKL